MKPNILVVGVGRLKLGDDAAGIIVADRLKQSLKGTANVVVDASGGWETLDTINDKELLVLIDAAEANTRFPVGQWCKFDYASKERLATRST